MSDSKNDTAWIKLFDKYNIVQKVNNEGFFNITATQINEFREARLMTKFDHKLQLPKIFMEYNLSILPITRGNYIISTIKTFHSFEDSSIAVERILRPPLLESLDYKNITSESTAINCAFVSGILSDFADDEDLRPTVSGRMSSSVFNFNVEYVSGLLNIEVQNSQIEIDGGYEGVNSFNFIEAKNYVSEDFLIRQLYYPYRLWLPKITKVIKPIFLTYTNGIFHLREYAFEDYNFYNSLRLIKERRYTIQQEELNLEVIQNIIHETEVVPEPQIPFPQADSFERIINLCELLNQKTILFKNEITRSYLFDERQTNYYTDAGRYLNLIEKSTQERQVQFSLTEKGKNLFKLSLYERQKEFIRLILTHLPFKNALKLYFSNAGLLTKDETVNIMRASNLYNVMSDETFRRRASTILGWINWIVSQIEE